MRFLTAFRVPKPVHEQIGAIIAKAIEQAAELADPDVEAPPEDGEGGDGAADSPAPDGAEASGEAGDEGTKGGASAEGESGEGDGGDGGGPGDGTGGGEMEMAQGGDGMSQQAAEQAWAQGWRGERTVRGQASKRRVRVHCVPGTAHGPLARTAPARTLARRCCVGSRPPHAHRMHAPCAHCGRTGSADPRRDEAAAGAESDADEPAVGGRRRHRRPGRLG